MRCVLRAAIVLTLVAAGIPDPARAAESSKDYPARPIRFIVAQTPGSSIDTMTRVVATKMSELLGQQLVVDNRTGAGGIIGGEIVAHGESHLTLGPAPALMVHVQAGRMRVLAMGGEKRSPLWPDIPTIIESGLPGYVSDGWAGVMAQTGLPKLLADRLHATVVKAVSDPVVNEALKRVGAEPRSSTPKEFNDLIARDWKSFGEAIRVAKLKVD